jgi:cytochrome oxidase Cu insertion factor (SCO1/SenC/PrrC family)
LTGDGEPNPGSSAGQRRRWLAGGALTIVLLAAVAVVAALVARPDRPSVLAAPTSEYRGSVPPPGVHLPGFALRGFRGNLVTTQTLRDRVAVVTFLDTTCTDACPIIASVLGRAISGLTATERRHVRAFAITVDPAKDTPQSVRRFLRARGALGKLDFLLGGLGQLTPVWHRFAIVSADTTGNSDTHSADVRVYTRAGIWVSTLRPAVDLTTGNVVHDIRTALGR